MDQPLGEHYPPWSISYRKTMWFGALFFLNHHPFFSCLPRLTSSIHFRSLTLAAMVCPSLEQKELRGFHGIQQSTGLDRLRKYLQQSGERVHNPWFKQLLFRPHELGLQVENYFRIRSPVPLSRPKKNCYSLESGKSSSHNCSSNSA